MRAAPAAVVMTPSDEPHRLIVPVPPDSATTALVYDARANAIGATLILGHGAGAGQRNPFLVDFARALSAHGLDVVTFDFLYTEQQRRVPDRGPLLEACYRAAMESVRRTLPSAGRSLFIGGKSMGGRIATQVAAADPDVPLCGIVLLGYPLHPPGRPTERRGGHLSAVGRPMLFVQGSRDAFGTPAELEPVMMQLSPPPTLHVVEGGDHSFKVTGKDRGRQAVLYADIQQTIADWIRAHVAAGR